MFRKLVANLSFSPSLVGELGFYASQLKREETLRLYGLIAAVFLLVVQVFVSVYPAESANTAHSNDLIYGGFQSKTELLEKYERNEQNIQDILSSFNITSADLQKTEVGRVTSSDALSVVGRSSLLTHTSSEHMLTYTKTSGGNGSVYLTPLSSFDGNHAPGQYSALIGTSNGNRRFAILNSSGNLVVKTPNDGKIAQCEGADCTDTLRYSSEVGNATKNQPAATTTASPSDRLNYVFRTTNVSDKAIKTPIIGQFKDVLEYANIVDTGGGTLESSSGVVSWSAVLIEPGQTISKIVSVRLQPHLAATARGISNPMSFDCTLSTGFGNPLTVNVACPSPKYVEIVASSLPNISISLPLFGASLLVAVTGYFYFRARQQREEIRLIRKDINTSTF